MTGFKFHRHRCALEPGDVARVLGIRRQTIYNWEHGKSIPSSETLIKVSRMYGTTIDELLQTYPDPMIECRTRLEALNIGTD